MSSIGYVTIGAVDGQKSGAFYDAVFSALGSERKVSVLARYIATCRGRTTLAVRRDDNRSARLTLY